MWFSTDEKETLEVLYTKLSQIHISEYLVSGAVIQALYLPSSGLFKKSEINKPKKCTHIEVNNQNYFKLHSSTPDKTSFNNFLIKSVKLCIIKWLK